MNLLYTDIEDQLRASVGDLRAPHRPVVVAQAFLAEQLNLQTGDLLGEPGEGELHG